MVTYSPMKQIIPRQAFQEQFYRELPSFIDRASTAGWEEIVIPNILQVSMENKSHVIDALTNAFEENELPVQRLMLRHISRMQHALRRMG